MAAQAVAPLPLHVVRNTPPWDASANPGSPADEDAQWNSPTAHNAAVEAALSVAAVPLDSVDAPGTTPGATARSAMKQTLVGLAPPAGSRSEVTLPGAPSPGVAAFTAAVEATAGATPGRDFAEPATAGPVARHATLVGVAPPPEPVETTSEAAANVDSSEVDVALPDTNYEVGAPTPRSLGDGSFNALDGGHTTALDDPATFTHDATAAQYPRSVEASATVAPEPEKPSGMAKPYQPKDGPNTPPVVVDAATIAAAQRALRPRGSRTQQTPTIPGTLRAIASQNSAVAELAPGVDIAPRRSKSPWVLGLLVAFAAVGTFVFMTARSTERAPPAAEARKPAPTQPDISTAVPPRSPEQPASVTREEPPPTSTPAASTEREPVRVAPNEKALQTPASATRNAPAQLTQRTKTTRKQTSTTSTRKPAQKRAPSSATPKTKPVIVRESPF